MPPGGEGANHPPWGNTRAGESGHGDGSETGVKECQKVKYARLTDGGRAAVQACAGRTTARSNPWAAAGPAPQPVGRGGRKEFA